MGTGTGCLSVACWVSLHSRGEWGRRRRVKMCTMILQCACITTLRQWETFPLSFLRVGRGHLPLCCNGKVWWGSSWEGWFWLHLHDVHCQDMPLHQVPSARHFPALNPKIILGLHLLAPLYRASITHHCYHMAPWSPREGYGPSHGQDWALPRGCLCLTVPEPICIPWWLCLLATAFTPSKQLCCSPSAEKTS